MADQQKKLTNESIPTLRAIETLVQDGLDLLELSFQLSNPLSIDRFTPIEEKIKLTLLTFTDNLALIDNSNLAEEQKDTLNFYGKQLEEIVLQKLQLQQIIQKNQNKYLQKIDMTKQSINQLLIEIKLLNLKIQKGTPALSTSKDALFDLRLNTLLIEALVNTINQSKTITGIDLAEDKYRLIIGKISRNLISVEKKYRANIGKSTNNLNQNLENKNTIFSLKKRHIEYLLSLKRINQRFFDLSKETQERFNQITQEINTLIDNEANSTITLAKTSKTYLMIGAIIFILSSFFLYLIFIRPNIISRIKNLTNSTQRIAKGELKTPIDSKGNDEISSLSQALAFFRDEIIQKENYQKELNDSEKKLASIFKNASEGLITVDTSGNITSTNPFACTIFKAEKKNLYNKNIYELLPDSRKEFSTHKTINSQNETGFKICHNLEQRAKDITGKIFDAEISVSLLNINNSYTYSCFIQDITEKKEAQRKIGHLIEEITESNHDLEQFAYSCSHDLQEPIRMIISFSELLKEKTEGQLDDKSEKYLRHILDNGKHARQLIKSILEYSRLDKSDTKKEWISFGEICTQANDMLLAYIAENNAKVIFKHQNTQIKVVKSQFLQLLLNLMTNGLKYNNKENPTIELDITNTDQDWIISCKDNGIGIEEKYMNKIFDLFTRLVNRKDYAGSGIGLALCKKIANKHDGSISVVSTVGEGSTFSIHLPIPKQ